MLRAFCLLFFIAPLCKADPPLLVLVPQQLQVCGSASSSQPLVLRNDTHADMEWTSSITTGNGVKWLSITPSASTVGPPPAPLPDGPTMMQVSVGVSPTGLAPGVYTGSITITASRLYEGVVYSAIDSPQTLPVTYTVIPSGAPGVCVSSTDVVLSGVSGIGPSSSALIGVTNGGTGLLNWSAAVQSSLGGAPSWLSIASSSGINTGSFQLSASSASLPPGSYSAKVSVSAPGSLSQVVTVTYNVRAPNPATLNVATSPLSFTSSASGNPGAQTVAISNSGELPLNWRAAATSFNGGPWLTVSPAAGVNNGSISISANPSGLAPGVYAGRVTLTSSDSALQGQIPVTLTVLRGASAPAPGGMVNAASLAPDAVVAGAIVSIFGDRLGPDQGVPAQVDPATGRVLTTLGGTQVTIDGVAAPLFYVSSKQVNLQVPYELAGRASAVVHVEAAGYDPADFSVSLDPASVGLFTIDGKRAAALNQDGQVNSSSRPAAVGTVIQLYGTGQGPLDRSVLTGLPSPVQPAFPSPVIPTTVSVGGLPAKVLFLGLAPGAVGLVQINVEIPSGIVPSDLTPVVTKTGYERPGTVYISTSPKQ